MTQRAHRNALAALGARGQRLFGVRSMASDYATQERIMDLLTGEDISGEKVRATAADRRMVASYMARCAEARAALEGK